ncbi:hypothetical protein VOLCADRAFT_120302 [Volvox carteri f. nagariensis]|uniref:Sec-independent protein translocase protein TatA n=1 Tax=Volvox carteri f. nagariensis TaxID=3068 RepID=D8TJD3_VOLCA|nr:uncharacterized protein VOLCADRAFT_120302 [Volvox carteri f. nagariensis]EFJ52523.1 hypothetical protein VOLCADRAFT_120302 [Volvox carteri f. nagariensis]|eukprot:XP_002946596.1 hypothetical protein VOLCADRAFT_120302 [Volvox carteri f. nagariensis]
MFLDLCSVACILGLHHFICARRTQSRQVTCQGLFGLGLPEVAVIAGVAALVFGPSKLPELGKTLGKTVKSFQTAANEFSEELKAGMAEDPKKPAAEEPKKTDSSKAKPLKAPKKAEKDYDDADLEFLAKKKAEEAALKELKAKAAKGAIGGAGLKKSGK